MLNLAKELLDPRLLAAELVRFTVQVAAVHAGIPLPVARAMGQAAKDVFKALVSPDPNSPKVRAVQYVDLTLSAKDGSLINSPALREIATGGTAGVVDRLLGPDTPSPASPPDPTGVPPSPAGQPPASPAGPAKPPPARPGNEPRSIPQPSTAPDPHRHSRPGFGI